MGQVFLEPMMMELSNTRASVGSIFSILPAVTLGVGPIASVFINIVGCRKVTIAGACIASFGFFLSVWWTNIWFYYATIGVIGGIGLGLMYLAALASVKLYFKHKRGLAMGIAVCGSGVGTFVFSYVMNEIVNIRSWINYPTALLVEAGIILVGILCGATMMYRSNEPSEQRKQLTNHLNEPLIPVDNGTDGTAQPTSLDASIEKPPAKSFLRQVIDEIDTTLLTDVGFVLFAISNFLSSLGFNVVYNFADDLANDAKVIKDQRTYIVMSIGLSNIFGRVIIGILGDRKWVNRIYLFILTMIISGVATMAAPLCDSSVIQHIGYASFFGFFSGGSVALTPLVISDIVGEKKSTNAIGLSALSMGVAVAIGTPVVGEYLVINFKYIFSFL
ncbi:unnamed protein product [Adineta steineri]|uniref:Major facilitator superfamily (MFS) profile domain-containing protein n=1 Tax=Adineta steineri TaxID=433720 RepID=A0A816AUU2_9BILA|nr:unnamed protein product [Adineta steineri]CAF1602266.1 unnamed protein product [Adineta steineri]